MSTRRTSGSVVGVLNVNKPPGMTSHDVVARVRRLASQRRVGHAGTLDPLATGVLIICLGTATRLSEYLADRPKAYRAVVRFGVETDSWDADGLTVCEREWQWLDLEQIRRALARFLGCISQVPPMYSALKRDGRRLYELAREGIVVERPSRPINIYSLDVVDWSPPLLTLDIKCSKGTYVRSLAHDLGDVLNTGAHLAALTRLAVGDFTLDESVDLETLESAGQGWRDWLIAPAVAVAHLPGLVLDAECVEDIGHGRSIQIDGPVEGERVRALAQDGRLLAILRPDSNAGWWRPDKVFLAMS